MEDPYWGTIQRAEQGSYYHAPYMYVGRKATQRRVQLPTRRSWYETHETYFACTLRFDSVGPHQSPVVLEPSGSGAGIRNLSPSLVFPHTNWR
jgi:hypothetical protein